MSMAAPFPWFTADPSQMGACPGYPHMFPTPGHFYPPQPFPGFHLPVGYPALPPPGPGHTVHTAGIAGQTSTSGNQFSNVETLAQSSQTPNNSREGAPDIEELDKDRVDCTTPTEPPLKSPKWTTPPGTHSRTPERTAGRDEPEGSRITGRDSPRSPDSSWSAATEFQTAAQAPVSKYPDYCKTITVKDASGQVKELVFPKALDLDRPKRARTTFSPEQLLTLEREFQLNQYLVGRERTDLARRLGLSETQVKVWFQNRRTKYKRDKSREAEVECARAESSAATNIYRILQGGDHGDTNHSGTGSNVAGNIQMTQSAQYIHSPKNNSLPTPHNGLIPNVSPGFLPYNR